MEEGGEQKLMNEILFLGDDKIYANMVIYL